jgi:hypothetical protein
MSHELRVLPSRRKLKRWSRPGTGLLDPTIQVHIAGVRGSCSVVPEGAYAAAEAIETARGDKQKGWSDHAGFRLWFEGTVEPPGLIDHIQKLLVRLRLGDDDQRRLNRSRDGGLRFANDLVRKFLQSPSVGRHPVLHSLQKRLTRPADVESAMTALVQMTLGCDPLWDTNNYRSQDDPADLSVEELVVRSLGLAPAQGLVQGPLGQLLMGCDPFTLPDSLAVLISTRMITAVASAFNSATDPLSIEDLSLGREVVRTFSDNAQAFTRSAVLYYGRHARHPGSVHALFSAFNRISVARRPDARVAAWIVVGTALVVRAMLAANLTQRDTVRELLTTIETGAAKCRAYIAIVEATPPADRKYLAAGASARLARLDETNPAERKRVSDQLNTYLAAHPEYCQTLEVWPQLATRKTCSADIATGGSSWAQP